MKCTTADDAFSKQCHLNALLLNLFERGAEGVTGDNDLIGLALNLSADVVNFLKRESEKDDKYC